MTIKAILRHGIIQPIDPLPSGWEDGQELVVEEPQPSGTADLSKWSAELDAATAKIPAEEHDRFLHALDQIELDSKEAVRKQWKQPVTTGYLLDTNHISRAPHRPHPHPARPRRDAWIPERNDRSVHRRNHVVRGPSRGRGQGLIFG